MEFFDRDMQGLRSGGEVQRFFFGVYIKRDSCSIFGPIFLDVQYALQQT